MAVQYRENTNLGYGKEYSGTGQVELLLPSADKAYNDQMQERLIAERSDLETSVRAKFEDLKDRYPLFFEIYESQRELLSESAKLFVEKISEIERLRNHSALTGRNNLALQELIIDQDPVLKTSSCFEEDTLGIEYIDLIIAKLNA
jgi:hypothetical protein